MALSNQELHCITLLCRNLATRWGGNWQITEVLEDIHRNQPSPECRVSNGDREAAVEVKRLVDHPTEKSRSLSKRLRDLVPDCGGVYLLMSPIGAEYHLDRTRIRALKSEINRVAPQLVVGDQAFVRVARSGRLVRLSATGPGMLICDHAHDWSGRLAQSPLRGAYALKDHGPTSPSVHWKHADFASPEAEEQFYLSVISAGLGLIVGSETAFNWDEEWPLIRCSDEEGSPHPFAVRIPKGRVTLPIQVNAGLNELFEAVSKAVAQARKSFTKRWAETHIVVLHNQIVPNSDEIRVQVLQYVRDLAQVEHLEGIDLVYLVNSLDGMDIHPIWPAPDRH